MHVVASLQANHSPLLWTTFAPEAIQALEAATYPGNLRDLREVVVRASLHAKAEDGDEVRLEHLLPELQVSLKFERRGDHATQLRVVSWALWKTRDRVREAAELIGANRNTVGALRAEFTVSEAFLGSVAPATWGIESRETLKRKLNLPSGYGHTIPVPSFRPIWRHR
jgi:DNA-binding NtrC family response regulator